MEEGWSQAKRAEVDSFVSSPPVPSFSSSLRRLICVSVVYMAFIIHFFGFYGILRKIFFFFVLGCP